MRWREYFLSLSEEDQAAYAERAGTTVGYIRIHLVPVPPRKTPRGPLLQRLSAASEGYVSHEDVLAHFFPPPRTAVDEPPLAATAER